MSNKNCSDENECPICSTSYFKDIFHLALHKKYDEIENINLKRKLYRQSLIKEKLGSLNIDIEKYNYKEMRQEDSLFENLELYDINNSNTFSDNLNSLINAKEWYLLNFYYRKECENDETMTKFCKIEALKEREKKINKFLKKFFKANPEFKQVTERKGCHSLLFFNPLDTKFYRIYTNDEKNEHQDELVESWTGEIAFLNNKNPRDGKLVARSFIKNMAGVKDNNIK